MPGTSYSIGACDSLESTINLGTYSDQPEGEAGKPVQGHKTRLLEQGEYRSLWILGAVGKESVLVSGKAPAAKLYAIAEGLVLPE